MKSHHYRNILARALLLEGAPAEKLAGIMPGFGRVQVAYLLRTMGMPSMPSRKGGTRRPADPVRMAEIQRLKASGLTLAAIGKRYGITRNRVHAILYPRTNSAHAAVFKAVKSGALKRPKTCQHCNKYADEIEAHHADYEKPLDVAWLCVPCHIKADRLRGRFARFDRPQLQAA